jgi:NAD(P)-dependent dehydrogenase (short-subunit alcohol dehydrogenase family)
MFLSSEPEQFRHHIDLNFHGVLKIIHPIAKRMALRRSHGRIVIVGDSIQSHYAIPGMSPYACSKAALE